MHHRQIWFRSTPEFDAAVRHGFAADHDQAVAGILRDWEGSPEGALALVMLLDQVPRNIFRSTPRAFASDAQALATTRRALARCFDLAVPAAWRVFFYLPFEHSEVLADQQRGIALLEALPPVQGRPGDGHMSRLHLEIIERFGRFPHRNAILGRSRPLPNLPFSTNAIGGSDSHSTGRRRNKARRAGSGSVKPMFHRLNHSDTGSSFAPGEGARRPSARSAIRRAISFSPMIIRSAPQRCRYSTSASE